MLGPLQTSMLPGVVTSGGDSITVNVSVDFTVVSSTLADVIDHVDVHIHHSPEESANLEQHLSLTLLIPLVNRPRKDVALDVMNFDEGSPSSVGGAAIFQIIQRVVFFRADSHCQASMLTKHSFVAQGM